MSLRMDENVILKIQGWLMEWFASSCPSSCARLASSGCNRTFSPITKNVALTPCSLRMSSICGVEASHGPSSKVRATQYLAPLPTCEGGVGVGAMVVAHSPRQYTRPNTWLRMDDIPRTDAPSHAIINAVSIWSMGLTPRRKPEHRTSRTTLDALNSIAYFSKRSCWFSL